MAKIDVTLSGHAQDVLIERGISEHWVWSTIATPDSVWQGEDGNMHYAKAIAERESRILHVVVNASVSPKRVVTVFFDRRLKGKLPQ
jgi:hypothetical protein